MSSVSHVFKKNAYVVIGHQRSYNFFSIVSEIHHILVRVSSFADRDYFFRE